jgi:hypothetical protein
VTNSVAALSWPAGVTGAILLALAFVILTVVLEGVVRLLSPPPQQDPRLGYLAFWLIVAVVALATPVLGPAMERSGALLERIVFGLWALAWLAWKAGIGDSPHEPQDSQRDHEQIWALAVGMFVGFVVLPQIGLLQ